MVRQGGEVSDRQVVHGARRVGRVSLWEDIMRKSVISSVVLLTGVLAGSTVQAQEMPTEYAQILTSLGRTGDFKGNVLKVNIPRNDVAVTVAGVRTPTPFGFGGWIAMTRGTGGMDVMMGDLVLLQDEVNPVMSALLDNGLEVTALHNHFFWDEPRMFYMHVHGHGAAADLAKQVKPALDLIGRGRTPAVGAPAAGRVDGARVAQVAGHSGEQNGDVYKITVGRDDVKISEMGATVETRMGLNSWAAFVGPDTDAAVAGDIAMLASEVTPVLKALRQHGLDVVAIHHHMTTTQPTIYFLHYWGRGSSEKLAAGFKAALDQLGQ
jgi:Domain of Unknown Function (DUF1259)